VSLAALAASIAERAPLPDSVTRLGIRHLVRRTHRHLGTLPRGGDAEFAGVLAMLETGMANLVARLKALPDLPG